jgi:hypothetical protein
MQRYFKGLFVGAVAAAVVAGMSGVAGATAIVWGPAQDVTAPTNVLNNGTYVDAMNGYDSTSFGAATVNGVTILSSNGSGATRNDLNTPFGGPGPGIINVTGASGDAVDGTAPPVGDAGYAGELQFLTYSFPTPMTATMVGLTPGDVYQVQIFNNNSTGDFTTTYSGSTPVTLLSRGNGTNNFGQFATGTFTADLTGTESFSMIPGASTVAQFNFISLREIPEPTSLGLLGLGAVTTLIRRRRK